MATNSAMIHELSTTKKLDNTNYKIWFRRFSIFYMANLLEHLTVTKAPQSDKGRDAIDTITMHY